MPPALPKDKTVAEVLRDAARRLSELGIDTARLDARLLLARAMDAPDDRLHGREDQIPTADQARRFGALLDRRLAREPVSRILGERGFWSLDLELSPATLDPRPDSETLIEAVLEAFPDRDGALRVLDLGTGTGALLLGVLAEYARAQGIGVDLSPECVATASRNAARNGLSIRAEFRQGDWGDGQNDIFDVIMCNPPYIPTSEIAGLEPEVATYDPALALDGGADGLDCYRRLSGELPRLLAPNGKVFMEIGHQQARSAGAVLTHHGLHLLAVRRDLAGRHRCLVLARENRTPD